MDVGEFRLHAELEDRHWWFCARRMIIFSHLRRFLQPYKGRTIVEIGCGTGGNLRFLQQYYRVLGVDISPVAVAFARTLSDIPVLEGDYRQELAGRWGEIDGVLLADVLEHVDNDIDFMSDLIGRMKAGSVLLLTVPAHQWLYSAHDVVLGHKRRYSAEGLRHIWQGMAVEELFFSPMNCLLLPPIALMRLLSYGSKGDSSLKLPAPIINNLCYCLFAAERDWMRFAPLPWGVSLIALLRVKGG